MELFQQIRIGRPADAERLSVLATQVRLHTHATDGVDGLVAGYVRSALSAETFEATLSSPAMAVLVAARGDHLLGFAVVDFEARCADAAASTAELKTLYVQEHHLGRGVGRALLNAAEALARKRADSPLWLTVNAQNARAIAFYQRQGYMKVGTAYFALGEGRHENHVLIGPGSAGAVRMETSQ